MGNAYVIGGGANGIATAITLSMKGHQVTVLEARPEIGGRCGLVPDTTTVQPWAVGELGLTLEWADAHPTTLVGADGCRSISKDDPNVDAWRQHVDSFRDVIVDLTTQVAPDIRRGGALKTLWPALLSGMKLGRALGMELARIGPLSAEDWLDEWKIDRSTQAALVQPALRGAWMGPRSPSSALAVLFHHALSGTRIEGGMAALLTALQQRATEGGVTIRTDSPVASLRIEGGRVSGVVLADGDVLDSDLVVSTVGPVRTLLGLVPPQDLPPPMYDSIRHFRSRGIVAHMECSLTQPLFDGSAHIVVADDTAMVERAFDDAKHRRMPRRPTLEIFQANDRARILIFGVAHDLDEGWSQATRDELQGLVLGLLSAHGQQDAIGEVLVRTPADLEAEFGLEGGHLFHGEFALDQFLSFRPHPSLSGHTTGIDGLRLGGCGTHPAGGLTLVQGVLAGR